MLAPIFCNEILDIPATMEGLSDTLAHLGDLVQCLDQCLASLEKTTSSTTKAASPSPASAASKPSKAKPTKKEKAKASTTPATGVLAPQSICVSTLSKAILEKLTVTLSIMDDQAGHVVGHAGLGLKQVHNISGTKNLVSTTVTAGFCLPHHYPGHRPSGQ